MNTNNITMRAMISAVDAGKKVRSYKEFQIFNGDVHITHISTHTQKEAEAYFCGLCEGYRNNNAKGEFYLLDADGKMIRKRNI